MSEIVQKRNNILKSDIDLERKFAGSIDEIIIEMNSITVNNWPLFLSEEGDPNVDEYSGTPPYILGVMLKNTNFINFVGDWANVHGFAFRWIDDKIPPTEPISSVIISNNPLLDVSINNWIEYRSMQLGEKSLELTDKESTALKKILEQHYVVLSVEDWENKCKDLWKNLRDMLQNMTKRSTTVQVR
tara:strand:- start:437 stop:997 length:561 start_codon:yes stop_codon:yes gene_type:complete